ncbi:MAG: DNA-directed RNA polymerase subunit alpha [Ardenticatenales bacterium]|nr:DNA-directed RNA polymerase subunit alpha [Ardenticatenales bacterium]
MDIVYPRIERDVITRTYGRFIIRPLERGYGITVGNALRRVLLGSLPGAAVTSIRVTGIHHEFSPIPGAKEDMTQLILNVKQLRFKLYGDEPVRIRLNARGEGTVSAADINLPSQVELINPELPLLTLDSDEAEIEVEMTIQRGRGYSPADERGRLPIDEIPVDAIYSPIRRVRFDVERERFDLGRERLGSNTDYDRLVLSVWTDGTMRADEALNISSDILARHFHLTSAMGDTISEVEVETVAEGIPDMIADRQIEELGLQVRAFNCLKRAGISTIGEVLERLQKGRDEMLAIRNFGEKSLDELLDALKEKGYSEYLEGLGYDEPAQGAEEEEAEEEVEA